MRSSSSPSPARGLARFVVLAAAALVASCDDDAIDQPVTRYVIGVAISPASQPVSALEFDVSYAGDDGTWVGDRPVGPECTWEVDGSLRACNIDRSDDLACAYADPVGIAVDSGNGRIRLLECGFYSTNPDVRASDFVALVDEATAPDLTPLDVTLSVTVDEDEPEPPTTTTTTDPDNPTPEFTVVFEVGPTSSPIGALQFEVAPVGQTGGWIGVRADLDCEWLVEYDLAACNDKGGGHLSCAYVDTGGLVAPAPLLECGYASFDEVTAESFEIEVVDASAPSLEPLDVRVAVSSVTPR